MKMHFREGLDSKYHEVPSDENDKLMRRKRVTESLKTCQSPFAISDVSPNYSATISYLKVPLMSL